MVFNHVISKIEIYIGKNDIINMSIIYFSTLLD